LNNLRASLMMAGAMALFALEDAFIKQVSAELSVGQILLMLGTGGFVVMALICRLQRQPVFGPAFLNRAVLVRNGAEILGTAGFVTALSLVPLSTVSVILQASPLIVTMGAALIYRETVGWRRWTAILVGLAGVVIILRPGAEGFRPEALFAVVGVVCLSVRDLATRQVPPGVPTLQLAAWGFLAIVPAGLIALPFGDGITLPSAVAWGDMAVALVLGLFGYFALTLAVRGGDLAVVAPFRYARIVFALMLGWLVFAERPDAPMLAGAALIVGSGLYTLWREARTRRAARPSPAAGAPV
jgi:drug/metabolite transporter (DMT)-like permease